MERKSLKELKAIGEAARQGSQAAQDRQRTKRAQRQAQALAAPDEFGSLGGIPEHVANSNDVRRWWGEAMTDHFPRVQPAEWRMREISLAKKLLVEFGADRVEQGIHTFVSGWAARWAVQQGYKKQAPEFLDLWYARQEFLGDGTVVPTPSQAQRKQERMNQGEYRRKEGIKPVGIGFSSMGNLDDDDDEA
jgi:hypothetical protein